MAKAIGRLHQINSFVFDIVSDNQTAFVSRLAVW